MQLAMSMSQSTMLVPEASPHIPRCPRASIDCLNASLDAAQDPSYYIPKQIEHRLE